MKTVRIVFVSFLFIGMIAATDTKGQAVVLRDAMTLVFDNGYQQYTSISSFFVQSESIKLQLFKWVFMLDPGDPWIPEKGVNHFEYLGFRVKVKPDGECIFMIPFHRE